MINLPAGMILKSLVCTIDYSSLGIPTEVKEHWNIRIGFNTSDQLDSDGRAEEPIWIRGILFRQSGNNHGTPNSF